MKRYLIEKSYARTLIVCVLAYAFATGVLFGFLVSFNRAEARFHHIRKSLEETASWKAP